MARKNIKVSEVVHEALESRKRENETYDDVLRELLGLNPELDDLVAFFAPEHAEAAKDVIKVLSEQGEFERKIEDTSNDQRLHFVALDSDLTVASAIFSEERLRVEYRNQQGDMKEIGSVAEGDSGEVYSYVRGKGNTGGISEIIEAIEKKVAGSYRKWGGQNKIQ